MFSSICPILTPRQKGFFLHLHKNKSGIFLSKGSLGSTSRLCSFNCFKHTSECTYFYSQTSASSISRLTWPRVVTSKASSVMMSPYSWCPCKHIIQQIGELWNVHPISIGWVSDSTDSNHWSSPDFYLWLGKRVQHLFSMCTPDSNHLTLQEPAWGNKLTDKEKITKFWFLGELDHGVKLAVEQLHLQVTSNDPCML